MDGPSLHEPSGPHSQSLSQFPQYEAPRSIVSPPEWEASPSEFFFPPPHPTSISSGFPDSLLVPIYTPVWREALWE